MIANTLNPAYYTDYPQGNDKAYIERKEYFYAQATAINNMVQTQADIDTRQYIGEQGSLTNVHGYNPLSIQKQYFFNRSHRVVDMVSGYQRRNRKSTISVPVFNGFQQTADDFTGILMWNHNVDNTLETLSEAFMKCVIGGMSFMRMWVDFRSDPISGDPKWDCLNYQDVVMDPYFRKLDLSDCTGAMIRTNLNMMTAVSMFPDREEEILAINTGDYKDGKFILQPENRTLGPKNLLSHDEFYYQDYRRGIMLYDSDTGEAREWRGPDENLAFYMQQFPMITAHKQEIPTVSCDVFLQNRVMYHGPNPLGLDKYPILPVAAYYHPEISDPAFRSMGLMRIARDAQMLYNRRKVIELDILESQITSGFKYKENALIDPSQIFLTGQGRGLALKANAQMSDVEQILPPQVPPSMIELSKALAQEINEITGINEELLGAAVDDKVGILAKLRQGAGLTLLQRLFDQLDSTQKFMGRMELDYYQNNFTPGKVAQILQRNPSPEFYNKNFGKYDCAVEEGLYTDTQKQMQFAQILQLKEAGVPIPDEYLLEAATIQNKKELIDKMQKQSEQSAQMAQQQAQVQLQQVQAEIELLKANSNAAQAMSVDRMSHAQQNQMQGEERKASAARAESEAVLNAIKAEQEIEGMGISHIKDILAMIQAVQPKAEEAMPAQGAM